MNYGYNKDTKGWKEDRKELLANRLAQELDLDTEWKAGGTAPYVEVDNLYQGVMIRKITYLSEKESKELIKKADNIYADVMGD